MTTPTKYVANFAYTDQELLDLWRECHASITVKGQEYFIGDRKFTAVDSAEVLRNITFYEQRVNAASGSSPSQILARMVGR